MQRTHLKHMIIASAMAVILTGCGGSDDTTAVSQQPSTDNTPNDSINAQIATITGTAATGQALNGTVTATNANGVESEPVTVMQDGSYTITVDNAPPFLLKAVSTDKVNEDGSPLTLFSYSPSSGIANITELTTYALYGVSEQGNLNSIFDNWQDNFAQFDVDTVQQYAKNTLVDFGEELKAANLDRVPDIFTTDFVTDGTGLDKLLDAIDLSYNCSVNSCAIVGKTDGTVISGNLYTDTQADQILGTYVIDTSNSNIPNLGDDTMTVEIVTRFSNINSSTRNSITINGMVKPTSETEFCADTKETILSQVDGIQSSVVSCSYDGQSGIIKTETNFNQYDIMFQQFNDYKVTFS